MAQFQSSQPLEGLSTTKPPFFDGTNYNYWKNRMKVFMLANVPKAWIVTMKGPHVPMKVVGESEVPKEEVEWNDEDLVKIMINNKAINMLQCALNPTEFHRVFGCDTTKEMWDMLEVTHKGTSQVKELQINRLIYMYELFKMKPEESIQEMYTRLNDIVTNLKALGKVYPSQEVVRKVLRSLPKNWEAKKTAIEEFKDLNTLKLEDLIGKLMTYEIKVQVDGGVESSNEEDITKLISKEVKRFTKKHIKSKLAKRDEGESTKRSVKCYKCNKMGHYRNECPKLKKGERNKKSMKKKAFTATWSNDETSSTESESSLENGVANLCFMAQEDSYNDEEFSLSWLQEGAEARGNRLGVLVPMAKPRRKFSQFPQGNMHVEEIFRELGWSNFLEIKEHVYNDVVYQFYANLKPKREKCKTKVNGVVIQFSPREICNVLEISEGGDDEFENVNHEEIRLALAPTWDQVMEQQSDEEEGNADQEMVEQGEEEHGGDSPRPFQGSMQRTNRETMELMINEMWQLHTDFYGFWTEMRGRMDTMDGKLDQLVNHFFPPPPPSAT
ncbi:hypothetical protein SLEP1_g22252 [Rubroshorea leprosula]|uniref:CCHC-type domain-containing protein n=1 Tax=Rubroshorea leprosula TaxID=152421 RepID=A0AAV5JDZ1_9ROSI|nr:hypothetical protein SLEP1_g22252 [Rubroshorea leprosula]